MKKFVVLCLAATGLAGLPLASSEAHAAPIVAASAAPVVALPSSARINATVVVETRRPRFHRRYRTVRRVYYRHGVKRVVVRRVYY